MANDRAYVYCEKCGESQFLDKYYPSCLPPFSPEDTGYWKPERLIDFIQKHIKCFEFGISFGDKPLFTIAGEAYVVGDEKGGQP